MADDEIGTMRQRWAFPFGQAERSETARVTRGERPKVGLALSAGVARGWAQIGVIRELEASGVTPDIVVGTSIGAVVGGCYGAGRLDQIEAFAGALNKRRVFGLMDVTLSGMGLLAGRRLKTRLDRELGTTRIEDLPVRFAAVATEVHTGHEVWLTAGLLADAIRASYALPGLFEPVAVNGRWLMDGALVNPIPVSVCRALGADIVVAVTLAAEPLGRYRPPPGPEREADPPALKPRAAATPGFLQSWWPGAGGAAKAAGAAPLGPAAPRIAGVLVDAFNITQDRIARSRLAGDPPDVLVTVRCGNVGLFDFHRALDLIGLGRDAVQRALPDLREYLEVAPAAVGPPGSPTSPVSG